ncbi:MAG: type II toxin-antitoxin system Phd/YefM family antitoxin [Vulcanimicrobiaceae bacterium]
MGTKRVGAREANQRFAALLKDIEESGDVVIITRRGQPIVEMRPAEPERVRDRDATIRRMREMFAKYSRPMGIVKLDRDELHER